MLIFLPSGDEMGFFPRSQLTRALVLHPLKDAYLIYLLPPLHLRFNYQNYLGKVEGKQFSTEEAYQRFFVVCIEYTQELEFEINLTIVNHGKYCTVQID